jgi:tetratricopeptide (TPR) repeat protein
MTFSRKVCFGVVATVLVALILGSGCGAGVSVQEAREARDPLLRRARERRQAQDMPGAIAYYQRALDKKPTLARAHLELGSIYDQSQGDYVRAIYHYERYLELQPEAEKKDLVHDLILRARISFAASLPDKSNEAVKQIAILKQEITALQQELERYSSAPRATPSATAPTERAAAASSAGAATSSAANAPVPAVAVAMTMEPYVVVSGDTLSRIAAKVYGDSQRWQEIYDANRAVLPKPQSIRVGQTLQIPKKSNR